MGAFSLPTAALSVIGSPPFALDENLVTREMDVLQRARPDPTYPRTCVVLFGV